MSIAKSAAAFHPVRTLPVSGLLASTAPRCSRLPGLSRTSLPHVVTSAGQPLVCLRGLTLSAPVLESPVALPQPVPVWRGKGGRRARPGHVWIHHQSSIM